MAFFGEDIEVLALVPLSCKCAPLPPLLHELLESLTEGVEQHCQETLFSLGSPATSGKQVRSHNALSWSRGATNLVLLSDSFVRTRSHTTDLRVTIRNSSTTYSGEIAILIASSYASICLFLSFSLKGVGGIQWHYVSNKMYGKGTIQMIVS